MRNVWFRYAETEPFILGDINLRIEPGGTVAIMGPSGGRKATLIKIMLGLLQPTSGEVLIDGLPLASIGVQVYREQIGAVMQEDQLLSGSIADNICFYEPVCDQERMMAGARLAGVHDEIMTMPMTYSSLIGDMGSSLYGGQKQHLLLARALYRQPKILFLDEGTAHLDLDKEAEVNRNLQQLALTRINVAHPPEVTSETDRIFWVSRTCKPLGPAQIGKISAARRPPVMHEGAQPIQPAIP